MFSAIIPKLFRHKDLCEISDDRNPGAFNAFKHCGKKIGCLCLLLDVLKGFVPVLLASLLTDTGSIWFSFVMLAPVLGHAVGAFNRFRGGKCIAVSFGVMFGIIPVSLIGIALLATLYIAFSTVIKIPSNRIKSIVVYTLFGVISCIVFGMLGQHSVAVGCAAISVTAVVRHLKIAERFNERRAGNEK